MRAPEEVARVRMPSLVERSRLFAMLSAGFAGGVTLVSAPAGSGKTTLLRSWVEAAVGGASDEAAGSGSRG